MLWRGISIEPEWVLLALLVIAMALGRGLAFLADWGPFQLLWGNQYFVSGIYHSFNPNRFAAFPSLHAAFPALAAVYAWRRYRPLSIVLIVWSIAVLLAIVYLGEHYVVDALAGYVYVAAATLLVEGFLRLRARRAASMPARPSA